MKLPTSDPQFWLTTLIAIAAFALVLRVLVPWGKLRGKKGASKTTRLTVGGRAPSSRRK
jgi:hypothetical protein